MVKRWGLALVLLMWASAAWGWQVHGFVDGRSGMRLQDDAVQRQAILNEVRLQLDLNHMSDLAIWQFRADLVGDEAAGETDQDLERGHGVLDLREANVLLTPFYFLDVKLGRQILTWGTGDLLFINDLFPKDWQSFFIGRDVEYLKAPSDAAMFSFYPSWANIDIIYVPRFDADRYISGERISYWNPMLSRRAGSGDDMAVDQRGQWFREDEWHLRISRNIEGVEWAAYAYDGYWKSPQGVDSVYRSYFPKLRVFGASVRGSLAGGVVNLETGYYDSREDRRGDDAMVPNSEMRVLVGYEREIARNFSAALQYYLEYMQDYSAYRRTLPEGMAARDEDRHVVTLRLTRQLLNQNLELSLFSYWSPSDRDSYLRPYVKYKASDAVSLYLGANLFFGDVPHTFFGQFEDNSNLYAGVRYSF
ncbi:hypothetical protein [uncultured Desulfuromonas sp.]|uniref:hypothetical protein n=1 Tax=uncultured Desulfuromonas sp. TaxID=181013 RepID=UPI002AAC10E6|nr:hypothetical protein [uncultured Desulfuromonas sp.]